MWVDIYHISDWKTNHVINLNCACIFVTKNTGYSKCLYLTAAPWPKFEPNQRISFPTDRGTSGQRKLYRSCLYPAELCWHPVTTWVPVTGLNWWRHSTTARMSGLGKRTFFISCFRTVWRKLLKSAFKRPLRLFSPNFERDTIFEISVSNYKKCGEGNLRQRFKKGVIMLLISVLYITKISGRCSRSWQDPVPLDPGSEKIFTRFHGAQITYYLDWTRKIFRCRVFQ